MTIIDIIKTASKREFRSIGDLSKEFKALMPISESSEGDITWIKSNTKDLPLLFENCLASCVVCDENSCRELQKLDKKYAFVITDRPDLIFYDLLSYLHAEQTDDENVSGNIHPTAIISDKCKIGKNVIIGAYSIIDKAEIGDNVVIGNNVRIFSNVSIGNNSLIREFCSIGGQGFGFVKSDAGYVHMPHIGKVIIEDNVQVFPFCNIDRATLSITRIKQGVRIDHYSHIGHNCVIGNNTVIAAQTVTCGGVKIGSDCFIGVNSVIKEKLVIGNSVMTGLGSVITKNIPDGEIWMGNPAKKFKNK